MGGPNHVCGQEPRIFQQLGERPVKGGFLEGGVLVNVIELTGEVVPACWSLKLGTQECNRRPIDS